jgi:hypothetical protein
MHLKSGIRAALGLAALVLGGTAMAQTTNLTQTTGDVFVNIVDTTNNTSFVFDTGLTQASFSGTGSYSYTLTGNSTYQQFVSAEGGSDVVNYSVISATGGGTTGTQVLFTTNSAVPTLTAGNVTTAESAINGFMLGAADSANNSATTALVGSALLGGAYSWGAALTEGVVSTQLIGNSTAPYGDNAAIGTALNFYDASVGAGRSGTVNPTIEEAGTWTLSAGVLTYSAVSAVPLPTPILLLLSGLGFMGVVARRNKTA